MGDARIGSFMERASDGDRVAALGLSERGLLVGPAVCGVVSIPMGAAGRTESGSRDATILFADFTRRPVRWRSL